jgi:glycosyltransferase involved in cell wall biosynthesis
MKILVVQDHLRSGGTERQSVLLSSAFAAAGHATTLLTFRPGGALAGTVGAAVAHRTLQRFDTGLDWFAPGLPAAINDQGPDLILCMGRMANCYGAMMQDSVRARHPGAVVIATMRTGRSLPWLFRRSLRRVRHVVANSRAAKQVLAAQLGIAAEKISVIHNSLVFPLESAGGTPPRDEALRAAQGAGPASVVLLCVAMFRPEKNQRELIEIAAGLPAGLDWQLWLAGDGPARAECERLARARQSGERIKFFGWLRDPSDLYAAADIAVHASGTESLSNFLIESQARGLPAVACEAQGVDECFIPGDTGFVIAPGDRPAFRSAIVSLAGDRPADREARGGRARAYARATFDPQRQVAAYLDLFEKLAAPGPR